MAPIARPNETETIGVDDGLGQYRPVSGLAVAGVVAGILSVLAFAHPLLYLVPLAAVIINVLALRQIAEASPQLVGRKAALVGLALALILLGSAPILNSIHRRHLRAESIEIAREWFTALRDDRPEVAFRLSKYPTTAETRTQPAIKMFDSGMMSWDRLRHYVDEMPVKLLLNLGKRARVRLYANDAVWSQHDTEGVRDYYVVTVDKGSEAISFFVLLGTSRTKELTTGEWQWQVTRAEFVSTPEASLIDAIGG